MSETRLELERLREIGIHFLPATAVVYAGAAQKVDQTRIKQANLFETPGQPAGTVGPAFANFCLLRDHLQNLARTTCVNLRDSGAGIVKAADDFSKTDLSHSEQLEYAEHAEAYADKNEVTPPENPPAP